MKKGINTSGYKFVRKGPIKAAVQYRVTSEDAERLERVNARVRSRCDVN